MIDATMSQSQSDHIRATHNTRRAKRQLTHDRLFNKESVDCSSPFSIADWDQEFHVPIEISNCLIEIEILEIE